MIELTPILVALVPVIVGLVEVIKRFVPSSTHKRVSPLSALFLGVLGAIFLTNLDVPYAVLSGLVVGLTASGLYAQGKAVLNKSA